MHALQLQPPKALPVGLAGRRTARAARVRAAPPAASDDGMSWLNQQAGAVEEATAAEEAAAAADAADDSLARSVGLHLRGRSTFKEGVMDEEDPARFPYHRALKSAALTGNWGEAESVVDEMSRAGNVPGPRAYHALVCAYVQSGNASGALGAIRRCWDAGITPLAETYAAVVSAAVGTGDLDTAEAVVASNRRAGVDCTRSWQHLVIALFKAGQADKGMEVLSQGEAEGLLASEAVYEALIQHFCEAQDLESARRVLELMRGRVPEPLRPGIQHYTPIILAHSQHGDPQVAFALIEELRAQGTFPQSMLGVCHTVVEAQLRAAQSPAEVASHVLRMKAIMLRHNLQPGASFFTAQLQAALRLGDLQSAIQAFRALRHRSAWVLQGLDEDMLAQLLLAIGHADLPSELHEVLAVMSREERSMPAAALAPDEQGCTILGAWVKRRLDQAAGQAPNPAEEAQASSLSRSFLMVDGVRIDPQSLVCLDATSAAPMAVSRMGVRELRAELAARKAPVSGNKKELAKRVQRLRQIDDARLSLQKLKADQKTDARRKVAVIVTDAVWMDGKLVTETRYESEREVEAAQEDEGDEGQEWDMEDDEGGASRRPAMEEDLFDDEQDAVPLESMLLEHRYILPSTPMFTSPQAGAHNAASLLLAGVVDLHAVPTTADLQALSAFVHAVGDPAAALLMVAALDRLAANGLADQVQGAHQVREELAEFCSSRDIDVAAAVASVLRTEDADDPLRAEMEAQMVEVGRG